MEIKRNDATSKRPEGNRIIDAPYVCMDIPVLIEQLKAEKTWAQGDRNSITTFKSDQLTTVLVLLKAGAEISNHTQHVFFSIQVLHGEVVMVTQDVEKDLTKGQVVAFHPQVLLSIRALTESYLLITCFGANALRDPIF